VKLADAFDLVLLEASFTEKVREAFNNHPILKDRVSEVKDGVEVAEISKLVDAHTAVGLYENDELIGCVKRAHEYDKNLSAHVLLENLATKASGVVALMNLFKDKEIDPSSVVYIIECSEEAVGDMNQRGGGNLAKSVGEIVGLKNATGIDMRGFCAGPTHSLINAAYIRM